MAYYQFFAQAQSEAIEPSLLLFGRKRNKAWEKNDAMKRARAAGLSQQELADRLGVSRQTINAIEKGGLQPPPSACASASARCWG